MNDTTSGLLTIAALVVVLALAWKPFGDHMARVVTGTRHARPERALYRLVGVDPQAQQSARSYATSVLAFSGVSILVLVAILMGQQHLPFSRDLPGMPWDMAANTAVSFVTNTNWQSYAGESTLGFTAQMAGLAVQNFLSAAVGICVAVALVRGFLASRSGTIGNFWVDLVRVTGRILLPVAVVGAVVLLTQGWSRASRTRRSRPSPAAARSCPAARSRARRRSSSSARTAVASSTRTRRTRSRTRRRSPTSCRSRCCC